ncbi:MAG: hypothetical protein AAF153_00270 [Pseudomonadota bacterium]
MTLSKSKAFTLVELSIVLVTIGLIVFAITSGADMIKAAKLRNVIAEFKRYELAINVFRDKYNALPGDMSNATDYWGTATSCSGLDPNGTCNGNGNGFIEWNSTNEMLRSWQMLRYAGLVEGDINTGWSFAEVLPHSDYRPGSTFWIIETRAKNAPMLSLRGSGWSNAIDGESSWKIDTKIDDGIPNTGNMRAYGDANCAVQEDMVTPSSTNYSGDATYVMGDTNTCGVKIYTSY